MASWKSDSSADGGRQGKRVKQEQSLEAGASIQTGEGLVKHVGIRCGESFVCLFLQLYISSCAFQNCPVVAAGVPTQEDTTSEDGSSSEDDDNGQLPGTAAAASCADLVCLICRGKSSKDTCFSLTALFISVDITCCVYF